MMLSTKFNFNFATLKTTFQRRTNNYPALKFIKINKERKIEKKRRIHPIKTSNNISKLAKRKILISRKYQIIINDTSIHNKICQNVFMKRRSNFTTMFSKQNSSNMANFSTIEVQN
jgi:hypothetical protein